MTKLRILHLSDLHLRVPANYDQDIVLRGFREDVRSADALSPPPDLVVFSGDLLQAGSTPSDFRNALTSVIDPILNRYGISRNKLVVCPGNHDVNREVVRKEGWVEAGLVSHLSNRERINEFIDANLTADVAIAVPPPFARLSAFYEGVWRELAPGTSINPFFVTKTLLLEGITVGVCVFNSAWRCTGESDSVDRARLILGERVVDRALDSVADADLKLAVFHHPTDWLTDEDRSAVEPRLHLGFDLMMFGHVHQASPQFRQTGMGGAIYSQAGCLYDTRRYFNGYSLIEIDADLSRARVQVREYSDRIRAFTAGIAAVPPDGEVTFDLSNGHDDDTVTLKRTLTKALPAIRRLGNTHVSLGKDDPRRADIERAFVCPPIKPARGTGEYLEADPAAKNNESVSINDALSRTGDVLLLGRPEGGKTSIGHYCALRLALGFGDTARLPLMGKFKDLRRGQNEIWRAVRAYANEVSDGTITSTLIETLPTFLIIDDVDLSDREGLSLLNELRARSPNARWLMLANAGLNNAGPLREQGEGISNVSAYEMKELPRSAIRALSAEWLDADVETASTDRMFHQVMEHIQRSGLPRSGYIVSLILWTLRNKSAGELLNEAVLIQNIVDHLLDKMDYEGALRGEFDFTSKTAVLQDLALFYKDGDDVRSKNDVVSRVIAFLATKGLSYDADEIVSGFIACGILQKVDDQVSFRYGRFQDFFLAGQMRDDKAVLERATTPEGWLSYARELDIYTSRFRHEASLLEVARDRLTAEPAAAPKLTVEDLYDYLGSTGNPDAAARRLKKMRREPMTAKRIDELKDRAEESFATRRRHLLKKSEEATEPGTVPVVFRHLRHLELYGQLIRNLEFADATDKLAHLERCLDEWATVLRSVYEGFKSMFNELAESVEEDEALKPADRKQVHEILDSFESFLNPMLPSIISQSAYHTLGSEKLSDLLDKIAANTSGDMLRRLLAVFILMEVDPTKAIQRMRSAEWTESLATKWIAQTVEGRLYRYYLDRYLGPEVRREFESIVADLEVKLTGKSGEKKGAIMQKLARDRLASDVVERNAPPHKAEAK